MATEFCDKCKQSHPGRSCDYDEKGDCAETADLTDVVKELSQNSKTQNKSE